MNIVLAHKTDGYEAVDIIVADAILQPNVFKSRFEELKGRLTGETKDYYGSFFSEAVQKAKESIAQQAIEKNFDGVTEIKVSTFFQDVRGDVYIGANVHAVALKKIGGTNG